MVSDTLSGALGLTLQGTGNNDGTWGTKANANFTLLETMGTNVTSISTTGGTTTLTASEATPILLRLTNTLSTDATIVVPDRKHVFLIDNQLIMSTHTVTIEVSGGTSTTMPGSSLAVVSTDGAGNLMLISLGRNDADFLVGKDVADTGATVGVELSTLGLTTCTTDGSRVAAFNRLSSDGVVLNIAQDGTVEGSISVSGTTITYGSFCGSHWGQLEDGSKPDILPGTIMESIDDMCAWPGEENDQLVKCKISDQAASTAVYGVFLTWDEDDGNTNDMLVAALGAWLVRMQDGQTPKRGDLVESAGDGTGRVQVSGQFLNSTVAKITSSYVVRTYDDGSFLVPCTLHCG